MSKLSIASELLNFLRIRRKYWMIPLVFLLLLLGLFIVFSESSAVAPFIYTLF
ncbi:MAG TPA: DUF5989 family protein [Acidobacteriota bacterium]|nr:DUF5989 family protein [Acidobacteriota bacterium]HRR25358.1 DUF5989 family protein [Acidobacteriota bacterium]HRR57040.1 DUF5989 family protein [Acidobacteriota bacterium]HRV07238.1 DUF5989 family protein [Acidobacteriota bacterium]